MAELRIVSDSSKSSYEPLTLEGCCERFEQGLERFFEPDYPLNITYAVRSAVEEIPCLKIERYEIDHRDNRHESEGYPIAVKRLSGVRSRMSTRSTRVTYTLFDPEDPVDRHYVTLRVQA